MSSVSLFFLFMKFGALCFGGGFMIIPLLNQAFVIDHPFLTPDEFGNLLAVSQLLPGAVSVNSAAYVGFLNGGVVSAVAAAVGLITPSLLLAIPALKLFSKYKNTWPVQGFLTGARLAAFVMIVYATVLFLKLSVFPTGVIGKTIAPLETVVCAAAFVLSFKRRFSMVTILVLAGCIGAASAFLPFEPDAKHGVALTPPTTENPPKTGTAVFQTSPFDPDLCVFGRAGAWVGACACYDPDQKSGRYCDKPAMNACQTTADCADNAFCLFPDAAKETGVCFEQTAYPPIETPAGTFILSDSVMNGRSANSFCAALNARPAERADFRCDGMGPACLDKETLERLKDARGARGFFWLDPQSDTANRFYADINDGTVYLTRARTAGTMQALCFRKEPKI